MPDETSLHCICGYAARFPADTVEGAMKRSFVSKQCLASGKHIFILQGGEMVSTVCPKQGRQEPRRANYTSKQGRYLAFIYLYTQLHGQAPAEADMQEFFKVSPPSVHQMVLTLERKGLIERTPGQARAIKVLLSPDELPKLT